MLGTLIKKEIAETVIDFRFWIAAVLCVVMIPLGMYVSLKEYELRTKEYDRAVEQYRQRNRGEIGSEFPAEGFRPPSPFSVFSRGLNDVLNLKVTTKRNGYYQIDSRVQRTNPEASLFGQMDFTYIASTVLSILAFVFTFSCISGEKEKGTLKLMLSNNLPRHKVILSKLFGNCLLLMIPFLISWLICLLILSHSSFFPSLSGRMLTIIPAIFAVTLLFLLSIFNLGVLVSTLTRRSVVSMILALFVWVLFALVIPKASPMIAQVLYPIDSEHVVETQKRMVREDIEKELEDKQNQLLREMMAEKGITVKGFESAFDDLAPIKEDYDRTCRELTQQYDQRIGNELGQIDRDYSNQQARQVAITRNLSRVSPVCCFVRIVAELSGTGTTELTNFSKQAGLFQDQVKQDIYDHWEFRRYGLDNMGFGGYFSEEGFNPQTLRLPEMAGYTHVTMGQALKVCWVDIVVLVLFSVLFFTGTFVSFLRYDVR